LGAVHCSINWTFLIIWKVRKIVRALTQNYRDISISRCSVPCLQLVFQYSHAAQQAPKNIKNLASKSVAPGEKRAIAVSDPVVMIGKMSPGKNSNLVEADLLAYGSRSSNLSTLQSSGVFQIISAEVTGLLGILLLFIDWRLSRARRALRASEGWQSEKAYADHKFVEQSTHKRNR